MIAVMVRKQEKKKIIYIYIYMLRDYSFFFFFFSFVKVNNLHEGKKKILNFKNSFLNLK